MTRTSSSVMLAMGGLANAAAEDIGAESQFDSDAFSGLNLRVFVNSLVLTPSHRGAQQEDWKWRKQRDVDALTRKFQFKNSVPKIEGLVVVPSHDFNTISPYSHEFDTISMSPPASQSDVWDDVEFSGAAAFAQTLVAACRETVPGVRQVQTALERDPEEGTVVLRLSVSTAASIDDVFDAEAELNAKVFAITSQARQLEVAVTYDFVPA